VAEDDNVRLLDLHSGVLLKTLDRSSRRVRRVTPFDGIHVVLGMTTGWGVLDTRSGQIADIGRSYVGFSYFGRVLLPTRVDDPHMAGYEGQPAWFDRRFAGEAQLDHERIVYLDEDDGGPRWDQGFRVWDFVNGGEIRWFKGAPAEVRRLCAEAFAAAIGERRRFTMNLWDLQTRSELSRIHTPRRLISLARADHGRLCVLDDRGCLSVIAFATDIGDIATRRG
jgi:hypothetical protein